MTTKDLHPLLDALSDTREIVIRRMADGDELLAVWREPAMDARVAYASWCAAPSAHAYAAYLAAEDQADAALASLLAHAEPRVLVAA